MLVTECASNVVSSAHRRSVVTPATSQTIDSTFLFHDGSDGFCKGLQSGVHRSLRAIHLQGYCIALVTCIKDSQTQAI